MVLPLSRGSRIRARDLACVSLLLLSAIPALAAAPASGPVPPVTIVEPAPSPAMAQAPNIASDAPRKPPLQVTRRVLRALDWIVIGIYAAAMVGIGIYYSLRARTKEEYLLGGRTMGSSSIGLSLFATLISTITYLAMPGEIIRHGPVVLTYLIMLPVVYGLVGYVLIPYFMKLPVTSAYEILEGRLGLSSRMLAATIFLVTRLAWMALITYLTSKMLAIMLGWEPWTIMYISVAMGIITIAYTTMGGLRAVVLTDVIQSVILFGGAVLSLVLITVWMGGIAGWWPTSRPAHWDVQPFFSLKPGVRVTVVGSLVWMLVWWICTAGSDQMAIQRYLATRDVKSARKAFLITIIANLVTNVTLGVLGFALMAYFQHKAALPPGGPSFTKDTDYIFPYFIVSYLPVGAAGLVVAGILAAAMSSLSAGVNSSCSVITRDFMDRFRPTAPGLPAPGAASQPGGEMQSMKWMSMIIGVCVVLASVLIEKIPGNLVEVTTKTNHVFVGPLFALFFFAMFVPFATPVGALVGAVFGVAAAILVAYWDVITGTPGISFQWITLVSLTINLTVGCLVSLMLPGGKRPQAAFPVGTDKTVSRM